MEAKLIVLLISILLEVANTVPLDYSRDEAHIPPLIKNIYDKMSTVMDQGDQDISQKYLRIVKTLHWLEPVTLVSDDDISDGYHYTFTFNTSALQEQPTSVRLHLHTVTSDQLAVINVTIDQEVFVWRQPALSGEDGQTEVRISLGSSLVWTTSTLAVEVTSTVPIKLDHHFGLLLYMGGVPEAIDDLLAKPLDKPTQTINDEKERFKIGIKKRDAITDSCRLESFTVNFSELHIDIVHPRSLDIGRCVGECPLVQDSTLHAQVLNLLGSRDLENSGSGSEGGDEITPLPVSCTATSFRPTFVLYFNRRNRMGGVQSVNNLVAKSCGCYQCSP